MSLQRFYILTLFLVGLAAGCLLFSVSLPPLGPPSLLPFEDLSMLPPSAPSLPEGERKYIWDVEHHGMLLSKYGFKPLADALKNQDSARLASAFAPDFTADVPADPLITQTASDILRATRRQDAGKPSPRSIHASAFVEELLDFRKLFHSGKAPQVGIALMTLSPDDRNLDAERWKATCQLRLFGESEAGKPAEVVLHLTLETTKPTEETLAKGAWLHSARLTQSLVGQANRPLFRDVTAERGIEAVDFHDNWRSPKSHTTTGGVYVCDFDRDGQLDFLITDINHHALYKGLPGGRFRDVTIDMGLPLALVDHPGLPILAAFVDIDGDGWDDLLLGDRVYRNQEGRGFVDYTKKCNLRLPLDAAGVAIADYDRDGRLDLYACRPGRTKADSWLDGKSGDPKGNQLWRNRGDWQFEDVTDKSDADGGQRSTASATWLDLNNDGWPDLHVINEFGNGLLLVNRGDGTFRPHMLVEGPGDFGSMGVTCGDVDNDGHLDIYIANMYSKAGKRVLGNLKPGSYSDEVVAKMRRFVAGSQLYRNRGDLRFEPLGEACQVAAVGWAYGAALADFDNDGFLDIYGTAGFISKDRAEPDG